MFSVHMKHLFFDSVDYEMYEFSISENQIMTQNYKSAVHTCHHFDTITVNTCFDFEIIPPATCFRFYQIWFVSS